MTISETSKDYTQAKANMEKLCETKQNQYYSLTYHEEITQPWCWALPAPWVLSTAGKLFWYLRGSYLLPDRSPSF